MLHILCKRCKGWIPRKRGKHAYSYNAFEARVSPEGKRQIKCFCGRWTYDPRGARFIGTKDQIDAIKKGLDAKKPR